MQGFLQASIRTLDKTVISVCFVLLYLWELADLIYKNVSLKKQSLSFSRLKNNFSKGNRVSRMLPWVRVSLLSASLYQLANGFWANLRLKEKVPRCSRSVRAFMQRVIASRKLIFMEQDATCALRWTRGQIPILIKKIWESMQTESKRTDQKNDGQNKGAEVANKRSSSEQADKGQK